MPSGFLGWLWFNAMCLEVPSGYMRVPGCDAAYALQTYENAGVMQVRLACSPDKDIYMIIQEPETCRYVCLLYHPAVCLVEGMGWRVGANEDEDVDNGYYLVQHYNEEL